MHTYQKRAICKNFKEPKCRLLLQSFTGTSPVFLNQSQWRKRKRRASADLPTVMIWQADVHAELEGDSSGRRLGCKSRKLAKPDSPSHRWTWASLQPKVFLPHTPICRSQLLLGPSVAWEPWTKVCCSWGLKLSSPLPGWVLIILCPRKARGEAPRCGSDKTVVLQTLGLFNVKILHLILKASLRELFIVKSQRTTPKTSANKLSTKPEIKYSVGCKACVWPRSSVSLLHLSHPRSGWPPTRSWWSFLERRCLWEPNQTVYTDGILDISRVPQIRKIHNALKFKNTTRRFSICSEKFSEVQLKP